ncbi:MAG TPA: BrxA family protein [Acidimicrobiales bacterium]|nr:BrxA family protein [Acidimicrobiales bacterium]
MLSSRILKGGALLTDSRILVEQWDLAADSVTNLARLVDQNLLAKRSATRAHDVVNGVLRQRLVDPGTHVIAALKELVRHPRAFTEACYFEATRADALLGAFAEGPLWFWFNEGRIGVSLAETENWLAKLTSEGVLPDWTDQVRTRAAQGLLATTRDFGILKGAVRKEFASPSLSPSGFAYVAFRLHEQGVVARGLAVSPVWRRWLLRPDEVEHLFAEIAHLGVLRRSQAGSVVRFDWELPSLVEVAHAVA